jgi:hypothetical protein
MVPALLDDFRFGAEVGEPVHEVKDEREVEVEFASVLDEGLAVMTCRSL